MKPGLRFTSSRFHSSLRQQIFVLRQRTPTIQITGVHVLAFIVSLLLILTTVLDAFETILLPRRISRRLRYSRLYYITIWNVIRRVTPAIPVARWRETVLGIFGPLSMLGLFLSWGIGLILGFSLAHYSLHTRMFVDGQPAAEQSGLAPYLYFSGTTFFTLGLGDVSPIGRMSRALTVLEAGLGFGGLAVVIGYLPVLYQAFSKREATISLLDARAGSPPSGGEFIARLSRAGRLCDADAIFREWETWCAELLESHISFPVLAYYRSQHANQSWLAALSSMLDACAILLASQPSRDTYQAQLTFAMARHAAVDIGLIFNVRPRPSDVNPLDLNSAQRLLGMLHAAGMPPSKSEGAEARLIALRAMYEPFISTLADRFLIHIPSPIPPEPTADNWQRSAYMPRTPGIGSLAATPDGSHFD